MGSIFAPKTRLGRGLREQYVELKLILKGNFLDDGFSFIA